jgi:PAS domain-containing protein
MNSGARASDVGGLVWRLARRGMGSFHVQTMLIVALSVATVATALILLQSDSIRRQVLQERADGIARMASSLQHSANHSALSGGRAFQIADLQRRLPDIADQLGAVEVAIADGKGVIVAASRPGRIGDSVALATVNDVLDTSAAVSSMMPDNTFVFAEPFQLAGGEMGVLQTRLDLVSLLAAISQATATSIVPSVIVLLVALPLSVVVSNRILGHTYARDQKLMLEARFGSLVRHSSDLVMIVSATGLIQYVSPSVERVLGRLPGGTPLQALHLELCLTQVEQERVARRQRIVERSAQGLGAFLEFGIMVAVLLDVVAHPILRGDQ